MRFLILHESRGYLRLQAPGPRMTTRQGDVLCEYLSKLPQVERVAVHERVRGVVLRYRGERAALLRSLAAFSCAEAEGEALTHSSRALSRTYREKILFHVLRRGLSRLWLPGPVRYALTAIKALPYLWRMGKALLRGRITVELLDGVAIAAALLTGDFDTAGSVIFLLRLGEYLEEWTHKKSVEDLARSMSLHVDRVWKRIDGETNLLVPLEQVRPGDEIVVGTGHLIPLDGVIVEGEAMVNQASLTGESVPVAKRPGMTVYAGTVVEEGSCVLSVSRQAGGNKYDQIVRMIEDSEKLKSGVESRAARLADRLVPWCLGTSALTWLLTRDLNRAISVLMVDFSCALKLSMPLCVLGAMAEASRFGVTVKGGKFLEKAAEAETVILDKTGTLTNACPTVVEVVPFGGRDPDEMLRVAACLEEHFPHSMANAVVKAARDRGLDHEEMHSEVEYIVAHGIATHIGGERAIIGSYHFVFEDEGVALREEDRAVFEAIPPRYSCLYLALGGELAAAICITDPLRPEAAEVLRALKAAGIRKTVMLTGDSQRTAAAIAAEVGVDEFHAEVLPEDKARFVAEEQAGGRTVLMLGDGINDAPALSLADVGVAIGDGAMIAREVADITIAAKDLRELVDLKRLADRMMGRIHRNYRFVMGFNGALIGLSAAGLLAPSVSALLHNGSTLLLSLDSMTPLLRGGERPKRPEPHTMP